MVADPVVSSRYASCVSPPPLNDRLPLVKEPALTRIAYKSLFEFAAIVVAPVTVKELGAV
jgi:hypothetical protein